MVETRAFQRAVMAVILVNAATLGAGAVPEVAGPAGGVLEALDRTALGIFVLELLGKLYAYRLRFFRDPWNCFDTIVVGIALVPASGAFSVLRALRLLRILRLVALVPSMRRVVSTLLAAIPGVASIVGLLALVLFVAAVMATSLFGEVAPGHFGDLGQSLWTLFQVMTGEAWPDIADEVMERRPMAWIFFLVYILISSFVVLNLFLAVMVNAMESVRDQEPPAPRPDGTRPAGIPVAGADVARELAELRREVVALRHLLEPAAAPGSTAGHHSGG